MKIAFGGGAMEVGASFLMARVDGINIAMDCGVRMEAGNQLPDLSIIDKFGGVDAILLTHAHTDHSGALPTLCQEFPSAKLHMTHATRDLIRVLLYDSLKIMDRREAEIPLFTNAQVERVLANAVCHSPNRPFALLEGSGPTAEFYAAGHIAGAAGALVSGEEGTLFYSGDFSLVRQRTVEGAAFPRVRPDVAILESTYGDRLHASREVEEERLLETVLKVYERGGKLLIPAFSLGRSQEIILLFNQAFAKKKLPSDLMLYVDGMVNDMCQVFSRNPNYLRSSIGRKIMKGKDVFYSEQIAAVPKDQKERERIATSSGPCCIVSSSGMLSGGPSVFYAERLAAESRNYIALTGYQDEESPGRALLAMAEAEEKSIKIDGRTVPVSCEVGLYSLSAHADKNEIASVAQMLRAGQVFLNHGNEGAISSLASAIQRELPGRVYAPKNGEGFEIHPRQRAHGQRDALRAMQLPYTGPESLWEHVLRHYSEKRPFPLEDLMEMARLPGGEEAFAPFRDEINASGCFEADLRRPFLYRAVSAESLSEAAKPEHMEANEALAAIERHFPPESGLYKKGLRAQERVALLYFDFPLAQAKAASPAIAAYEEETGWKAEPNAECRPAQAESLIAKLVRDDSGGEAFLAKSPSYYREEGSFIATVEGSLRSPQEVKRAFFEKTGMRLLFPEDGKPKPAQKKAARSARAMEQNQALAAVDAHFAGLPHRPYKKGLKTRGQETGIELSFATEALGRRYQEDMDSLMAETGWSIWLNASPNQHELLREAQDCLAQEGLSAKKVSFMPDTGSVKAVLASAASPASQSAASDAFKEKTGGTLLFS